MPTRPTAAQPKKQDRTPKPGHRHLNIENVPNELIAAMHTLAAQRGQKYHEFYLRAFAAAVQDMHRKEQAQP